jgi:hypothetical protein
MHAWRTGATRALIAVAAASLLAGAVFVQTAGAGIEGEIAAPLTIVKVVDGVAPAGTTFTATVQCDDDIIDTGEEDGANTATVTFDASGQPTSADVIGFRGPGTCTVTETAAGGASTVAYACSGVQGTPGEEGGEVEVPIGEGFDGPSSSAVVLPAVCGTTGPVDPITVNVSAPDQSATVTITNTFSAATPAAQIVAAPAFTG